MAAVGAAHTLVGRTRELRAITECLERSPERAAAIEFVGPPGIGKSSLLAAADERARHLGHQVIGLSATEAEAVLPWAGLVSLHRSLPADAVGELPEVQRSAVLAAIGKAAPTIASAGPYVAAALRSVLETLAMSSPVLLLIDDLQWVDVATAGALAVAIRDAADGPATVIAAWREGATPRLELDRLVAHDHRVIRPGTLDASQVHELLRRRVGGRLTQTVVELVATLSGGNPLYAAVLADHVAAGGGLEAVPRSIVGGYLAQLDALATPTVDVLEHAAVLGRPEPAVLQAACPDRDVAGELLAADRAGLVTGRGDGLHFAHPLVAAALRERLGSFGAERVHIALAHVVDDPERAAVHLAAGTKEPDAAVAQALEEAAAGALLRGARIEAGQRFARAVELTPADDARDRWRRALSAADAFLGGGDVERAARQATTAAQLADGAAETALTGSVMVQVVANRDGLHPAHDLVCALHDRLAGEPLLRSSLATVRARIEQTFDLPAALSTALAAQAELEETGHPRAAEQLSVVAEHCRFVLGLPTDPDAAWRLARPDADPTDYLSTGWLAVEMLVWDHRDEAAVAALEELQTVSLRGNMLVHFRVCDLRAGLEARRGNLAAAELELRRAIDAAALTGYPASMAGSGLGRILASLGRHDEAAEALAAIDPPDENLPLLQVALRSGFGFAALAAGRWQDAVEDLQAAWNAAEKVGLGDLRALPFRADLVEGLTRVGRIADAARCAERIEELAVRSEAPSSHLQAGRARLHVLLAQGRFDEAVEVGGRLAADSRRLGFPTERCRILICLGSALRRIGRRREAMAALEDAKVIAAELDFTPWLERADEELARLGRRRDPCELTSTEAKIAELVAGGRSNREVASELYVSLRTVESNLTRIYRKLGLRSRAELAASYRSTARRTARSGPPKQT